MAERAIRVSADDVELKLTLSAKLQKKSFADAVLAPFTKAFNKRKGTEWKVDDLVSVSVDDEYVTDFSVPASVVLAGVEMVFASLTYRTLPKREMLLDSDPFSGKQWEPPTAGGTVDFIADEDDRSEIEKLKAERRAKRLEKEAAKATEKPDEQGTSSPSSSQAAPVPIDDPAPPTAAAVSAAASPGALALLQDAEKGIAVLESHVKDLGAKPADESEQLRKELTAALGDINKLMVAMDEISTGELPEAEQAGARARKKAASAKLENELMPAVQSLQRNAARRPGVASAATAAPAPSAPPTASAEIDSDED